MKGLAALAIASLLPLISGCVAAAIPIAAGAAIAKRHSDLENRAPAVRPAQPAPIADTTAASASDRSDLKLVATSLTALPPPTNAAAATAPAIAAFQSYALARAEPAGGTAKRTSAIIHDASALKIVRAECRGSPSAVFIDLDPGRGTFDPLAPGTADPGLAAALARLRERDVRIVWFSRLGTGFASATAAALAEAGLDPQGTDEITLMPDIAERKQSLRDAAAKRVCPVAMLGDERADFDELYLYLKNPDLGLGLDSMIGDGWFLASPFQPAATGDTP